MPAKTKKGFHVIAREHFGAKIQVMHINAMGNCIPLATIGMANEVSKTEKLNALPLLKK
jgi:hypothetical protein